MEGPPPGAERPNERWFRAGEGKGWEITSMTTPLVYFWLGSTGGGRREIVRDVLDAGLDAQDKPFVLVPGGESADATAFSKPECAGEWRLSPDGLMEVEFPEETTHLFFISDGHGNPVDQIEALSKWIDDKAVELARIVTVVDSELCHKNPPAFTWYQACIHFSDVVLMNRRENVPQKWISEFIERFQKEHYPCLFELVKKNRLKNPALLLHPEPRRISTLFDEFLWEEDDEEDLDEEGGPPVDPYLERLPSGRRVKEIPDIAQFLGK